MREGDRAIRTDLKDALAKFEEEAAAKEVKAHAEAVERMSLVERVQELTTRKAHLEVFRTPNP